MRYFDAEAFTTQCSDVMMTEPYFELVQIVPAIEEGYQAYEKASGL